MKPHWSGVFPAITTHLKRDGSLDLDGTARHLEALIQSGVAGIVMLGSLGENQSLEPEEKRAVIELAVRTVKGRVPVLSGVAETSTPAAIRYVRDGERLGLDGFMLMPAMIYKTPDPRETLAHFRAVARATGLPIMIYNNPISYTVDVTVEMFAQLTGVKNIVAIKESSEDTRRLTDLRNAYGNRFTLFAGVDDIVLESLMLGATGWVSGLTSVFPRESVALYTLATAGRYREALEIYRWFMPLLHLDTIPTLVQCIKLAEQIMGRGSEMVRAPRLRLEGAERAEVERLVQHAAASRPALAARAAA